MEGVNKYDFFIIKIHANHIYYYIIKIIIIIIIIIIIKSMESSLLPLLFAF
jgi:hypothetical protein